MASPPKKAPKIQETRMDLLIRLIGLTLLVLGSVTAYFTATTVLVPQLPPILYTIAIVLIFVGALALIAKIEG